MSDGEGDSATQKEEVWCVDSERLEGWEVFGRVQEAGGLVAQDKYRPDVRRNGEL